MKIKKSWVSTYKAHKALAKRTQKSPCECKACTAVRQFNRRSK